VGFRLGNYDHKKPLVIDPVLVYSTFLGGTGAILDGADAIVVDGAGNAYVTGSASSTNFPVTTGAFQITNHSTAECANAYVTKLNPGGTALIYSTYLGGSGCGDYASSLAIDGSGDAYVVGQAQSADFPVTTGAFLTARPSDQTGFVTELNQSGSALVYSTYLGGSNGSDSAAAVAVDGSGNAYVVGAASSTNFPVTTGAYQAVNNIYDSNGYGNLGGTNAFVAKLNPAGSALVYSTYLGGSGMTWGYGDGTEIYGDRATGIAIDGAGDAYIVGSVYSANFPITTGAYQTHNNAAYYSGYNAFVTKLNSSGTALVYSTYLGGGGGGVFKSGDGASGVAVDSAGNAYLTGSVVSGDFPVTTGAFQTTKHAVQITDTWGSNAFVTKLNPAGSAPIYSTYLGGSNGDGANGLAVDASGNVYVAGYSLSVDFPVTKGAFQPTNHTTVNSTSSSNAFVSELNAAGNSLVYSTYLGGSNVDSASGIALDGSGNAYVAGAAGSSNFPVTTGAFQTTNTAGTCCSSIAFITKMDMSATTTTPLVTLTPSSSTVTATQAFTVTVAVSGPNGSAIPTGSVTLSSGNYTSALETLSGGSVVIDIPAESLAVGTNLFTAIFSPDGNSSSYASASGTTSVAVTAVIPTITVAPSVSSVTTTQAFSVAIAVSGGSGNPTPTGSVIVTSGAYSSAPTTLSSGAATITIYPGSLGVGVDSLTVSYTPNSASANVYASASGSGSVSVTAVASATSGWTWMAGSSVMSYFASTNQWGLAGVYGTQGTGAPGNTPGGRQAPSGWTDSSGHLWLFGGDSFDSLGNVGWINDLWEFNPSTQEWTWMGGSKTSASHGVYGTQGVFAAGNIPGGRWSATSWKDGNGNFWLLGGYGYDVNGSVGYLNDLWQYNPGTNQWAWISGSDAIGNYGGEAGVYGTLQTPAQGNIPGGRKNGSGWTDASGHLWLFGGFGPNVNNGNMVQFDDLWEFTPSTGEWAWMGGSNVLGSNCFSYYGETVCGQSGTYGTQGQAALGNTPGGRDGAVTWTDSKGNLWLFGGNGFDILTDNGLLNDLWEFSPSTNEWTWIGGDQGVGGSGIYGSLGSPSVANLPGGRTTASSWIDVSGNLWLFGGQGYDKNGQEGQLNDLWEFNPNLNEWAWISGSSTVSCGDTNFGLQCGQPGIYGSLGVTTVGSVPGGRDSAAAWSDGSGNLWVFGGEGYDEDSNWGWLNDLWRFQPTVSTSPSFTLSQSTTTLSVGQGSSSTDTITVTPANGFTGAVTLSATGLPNGVTAGFATNPATSSSVLTLTTSSTAAVGGPVTVTITGTSGTLSASTTIALTIAAQTGSLFDNIGTLCGPYSQTQPSCGYYPVFGPTGDFAVPSSDYAAAQFTPSVSGMATDARITVVQNEPGPGLGASGLLNVALFSDANGLPGTQISQTVTSVLAPYCCNSAVVTAWFSQSVSLEAGVPYWLVVMPGASDTYVAWSVGGFSPVPAAQTLTSGETPQECDTWCAYGPSPVQFAIDSGTVPPPGFMLSASPTTLNVTQGGSATSTVTVTDEGGFSGAVGLTLSGLPSGVTASFVAGSAAGSQVLTLSASSSAAVSSSPATVTIVGTSGSLSAITAVAVTVTATSGNNVTATPTYSPIGGTYTSAQTVTISDATAGAVIYYTTNGTMPTNSSSVYGGPITVSSSETLEAIAVASGYSSSAVATATYTITTDTIENLVFAGTATCVSGFVDQECTGGAVGPIYGTYTLDVTAQQIIGPWSFTTPFASFSSSDPGASAIVTDGLMNGGISYDVVEFSEETASFNEVLSFGFTGASALTELGTISTPAPVTVIVSGICQNVPGTSPAGCEPDVDITGATALATQQAAPPTFSIASGTYTSAQTVTISDATSGATIYYTTNGTTPTTSSSVYSGPISVSSSETLEAFAVVSGYSSSAVATATYTINPAGSQGFVLYSTVGNVGSHSEYPNSLITVDPTTGAQQLVGQSGQSINVEWLAADPVNNVLYGTGLQSSGSESALYAINPNSGDISSQVTLSQNVSTIAVSPQGTLYGLSGNTLGTINAANGQFSSVGTLSLASGYVLQAMTFSPGGVLYGVEEYGSGATFNQQLITLNPANGAILSDIGSLGLYNIEDITYAPDGNIYATNFSYTLLKIDPQTASNIVIGGGSIGDLDGIAAIATAQVTETPTFSPVAGTYTSAQTVTISESTPGATIYYTTNGTTPTTSSTVYSEPVTVSSSETIEAIATASGYSTSAVATAAYTINLAQAATPTFSPGSGTYTAEQSVTISDSTSGATIYYTTNGTTPTANSTVYSGAIIVSSTETLEAIAVASGYSNSAVTTATYTINPLTGATPLVGAPNAAGSYYGMYGTDLAAEFTLSSSAYVTTIDVVVLGSGIYDFSLQNSLTGSITTFAQAVITAPDSGSNTEAMTVNATLPAGTYYLVASEDATSTQVVPGWWVSDGDYLTNAGNVANGDWYSSSLGGPWTFESGVNGAYTYVAPTFVVNGIATAQSATATPTFGLASGSYSSAQSVTISDATTGATIYYTTNGTTPTTSSTLYSGPIPVSSTETLEAIATASGYTTSAVATATYTINNPTNPMPVISAISPAFTSAGGAAFTLTVNGTGFTTTSTVSWGTSALVTTYVSATQLTAQVTATDIATGGITAAITVQTPAPGGGTSNSLQFEVDSSSGSTTGPTFTSTTESVTAGSSASYPVTLPSSVTTVSVTCLNLPAGATCSYSSTSNTLTIATTSSTPAGTYQITVVFTETVSGSSAFLLLPIVLLPFVILRRKQAARGILLTICIGLVLLAAAVFSVGCGGSGSGGGGGGGTTGTQTSQVTSSGVVTLTVK
jgi:N-acetylneuraminic acid mutarotase